MDPDARLAEAACKGDRQAFKALVERHQRPAYNIALRFLRNRETALDITQEAFLRAFEHRTDFIPGRAFGPWLYKIVTNLCLNEVKRRRPLAKAEVDRPDSSGEPARVADARLAKRCLQREVDALPEKYRVPFVLRYVEERSCQEVAEVLGCPVNTVKIRLFRAREILRQRLAPQLAAEEDCHG